MCSIGEDDFGDEGGLHTMAADPVPIVSDLSQPEASICKSCNLESTVVKLAFKEPQCATCFLAYVRHKFRANIGSNKMIPRNGRVLMVYDGGANSSVLLNMLHYATTMDRFKKLHVEPVVLFVDDELLRTDDAIKRVSHVNEIKSMVKEYDLMTYYVSLGSHANESLHPIPIEEIDLPEQPTDDELNFIEKLNEFKTLTTKQEFVHFVTNSLIRKCAEQLNCKFIFNAEICPDLAIKLLANISLGRGSSVGQDIAFCDSRSSVRILRPIRDFSTVEISNYLKLSGVRWLDTVAAYGSVSDEFGSIQNLTKGFVDGLQENFQSTISTVFRTGSKIAAVTAKTTPGSGSTGACMSCGSALDCNGSATLLAIEFSRCALSSETVDGAEKSKEAVESADRLCYGCRNMLREIEHNKTMLLESLNVFK